MHEYQTLWESKRIERELELNRAGRLAGLGLEPANPFRGLARLLRQLAFGRRTTRAAAAARRGARVPTVRGPSRRVLPGA